MTARRIAENLLATNGGERRLTDILHISELLQEARTSWRANMRALACWLAQHIAELDSNASSQQMRPGATVTIRQIERAGVSGRSGCRLSSR